MRITMTEQDGPLTGLKMAEGVIEFLEPASPHIAATSGVRDLSKRRLAPSKG